MTIEKFKAKPNTPRQAGWLRELTKPDRLSSRKKAQQLHADLIREAKLVLDTPQVEGRDPTDGETERYNKLLADLDFIGAIREECEEMNEQQRALGVAQAQRDQGNGLIANGNLYAGTSAADTQLLGYLRTVQQKPFAGRSYAELFGPAVSAGEPFNSFGEFCSIIAHGQYDPRLMLAGMSEGKLSSGGYAVPVEYASALLDHSLEKEIVRPRAQVVPMSSPTRKVGLIENSDNSTSAPFGGLSLAWTDEGGEIALKEAKLRMVSLSAKKGGMLVPISNELLEDGLGFDAQISTAITTSVGWGIDLTFLQGTGAGQPLGILKSPSLIVISKETGQLAATIEWENLTKMYGRMLPGSIPNSVWICNSNCVPALLSVQIPIGTGGQVYPALREESGSFSLLGRPVVFTEKVPPLGSQGDVTLCDLSMYVIGLRRDIALDRSNAPGFSTDTTHLRALVRVDGQPIMDKAFTPKSGPTLSWAVTLAVRI